MRKARRSISIALSAGMLYAMLVGAVMGLEDTFIYFPSRGGTVKAHGHDVYLQAADGVKLHAFFIEQAASDLTLLYLQGNAGNLAGRSPVLEYFASLGVSVLALDYRGYGQSQGSPSEAGLYADVLAAYAWLRERSAASTIVVLGESLGGGPACELAATRPIGGLVLLSTFTSVPDMAARTFPFLPARLLVRTRYDNLAKITKVGVPKLVVHSERDEVIPFEMGKRLFAAANEPKQALFLERSGHNDTYFVDGVRLRQTLLAFLETVRAAR
jgi:fermentation-respiration switch protein FrsA (DUF1100 family)